MEDKGIYLHKHRFTKDNLRERSNNKKTLIQIRKTLKIKIITY